MKIIIVPNEPNPNMTGRHYGIAKALAAQGHEVHTVMWDLPHQMPRKDLPRHLFTSLFTKQYKYEDLQMHKFGRLPLFWPYVNGWLFGSQLKKLYNQLGADMIIAQSYTNETLVPASLPFIYDLADDYAAPAEVYGSAIYKFAFKVLGVRKSMITQSRNALAVTAVSDILTDFAKPYNTTVIKLPNGVETDIIQNILQAKPASKPKKQSIIYVSGFGPWSQPLKVMQAVVELRKSTPDLSLTLVGEGSEVAAMQQFIRDNDASSYIHYKGFVHDRAKVFELINQHEIGLNISEKNVWRDAAHPMKVIEYSALGKKVVSTNLTGVEALGLPNVFMFTNDATGKSLKKAMTAALQAPVDSHSKLSTQILKEYDWSNLIQKLIGIIKDAKDMATRPQVIHVTPSYPPALGGLEKVVQVLATTQSQSGLKVSVLTAFQTKFGQNFTDTVPVQRFKSFVIANTTVMPGLLVHLFTIPRDTFVHLHVTQAFTPEAVWLASKFKGFQYVAHVHLDVPPTGPFGVVLDVYKSIFLRLVLRHSKRTIVPTDDYKTLMIQKYGLGDDKVAVIPNATNHTILDMPKKFPHGTVKLLFVGRLSAQKNIPLLLNSLSCLASTYSHKFHLNIVGDGELKDAIQRQIAELHLEKHVSFKGMLSGKDLEDMYRDSDIFLLSSVAESFGLVLVEAMTKGLPIVSTDIPAVRNIVHNQKNGLLAAQNPEDFASVIHRIISDRKQYEAMSVRNLKSARNYSWDRTSNQIMKIYGEAT